MRIFGYVVAGMASLVGLIALAFVLNLGGLEWARFFNPKYETVRRQTFERNKSYVHGSIQDLGKRYREYLAAEPDEREAIGKLVALEFAEFDADLISSPELRSFLIEQRGY
jgi:hypothetical protein